MRLRTCNAIANHCRGLWAFLMRREDRRRDVELERERNAGTKSAIEALSTGGHLVEIEPGGRSRMIWMPEQTPPPHQVVARREDRPSPGELTP